MLHSLFDSNFSQSRTGEIKHSAMDVTPNAYSAGKSLTMESYFKRKSVEVVATNTEVGESSSVSVSTIQSSHEEQPQSKLARVVQYIDYSSLERDPGKRIPIGQYDVEQRDKVRIFYLRNGPYQPFMEKYPASGKNHLRRFQGSWFNKFRSWLEYSIEKDAAFCLPCYLFGKHSGSRTDGRDAFTSKGFRSWRKVGGKNCALVTHMGCSPNSPHNVCVKLCAELMDKTEHIEAFNRQTEQMAADDRLRLKSSITAVRWLTFQASSFRENDVSVNLLNMDNFIEMIELLASCNEDISNVVLQNAPINAKYISPSIQKEILYICARRVRATIREEIGDSKFCLIVDGVNDELKRERLALILRFVDQDGCVQERFFDVIHVPDASALALKKVINGVLSRHYLSICNLRGQGYDAASEMRAEWNTTQALFLKDCPYAYYGHCFAHHLDLALVTAAREVSAVHQFFTKLAFIVNVVKISLKKYDQLRVGQMSTIENQETDRDNELKERGVSQLMGDAKWDSHFDSILSLLCMFQITCEVLLNTSKEGNYSLRGDADAAYDTLRSFDSIFLLHLMKDLLGLSHNLCQALQRKNQDISIVTTLVFTTKHLIQRMKESGWQNLLKEVVSFCEKHDISLPNMNGQFVSTRGRCQPNIGYVTVEYYYHVELFIATINTQLQELNSRFNKNVVELLTLSAALDPRDSYKSLNVDQICELAIRFYPDDFTEIERMNLRTQVQHYELDVPHHSDLKNLSTLSGLCQGLVRTGKSETYHLIDRLLRLLLTLPLFASTSERSFSAVNIVDCRFKNKMEDDFLADFLVTSIEKEIAKSFDTDSIVEEFYILKELRTQSC